MPYSYGFAIILLTVLVKALTFPLSKKQVTAARPHPEGGIAIYGRMRRQLVCLSRCLPSSTGSTASDLQSTTSILQG